MSFVVKFEHGISSFNRSHDSTTDANFSPVFPFFPALNACTVIGNRVTDGGQASVDALTTRTARIELLEGGADGAGGTGGIVVARIGDEVQTLDDARANLDACARLAAPDRKPLLVDIRAAKPLLPEVRHTYMGERLDTSFAAMGLLVRGSPLGRTMGNVYLKIARPGIPTRIFAHEPKALAWLRERERT